MPAVRILSALPEKELRELVRDVLESLKVDFSENDDGFSTGSGSIVISECGKTHLGLRLHEIVISDEHLAKEIRRRLISKRAGG